ncbi:MAG: polysaccharide biosynthesis/export family protein, partial [Verrucomicrobiota bacterium]
MLKHVLMMGLVGSSLLASCSLTDSPSQKEVFDPLSAGPSDLDFITVSVSQAPCPSDLEPPTDPYRAGAGDTLEVEIAEVEGSLTRSLVMPDGYLYYDAAPGLKVVGKTIPEMEVLLASAVSPFYQNPVVTVRPVILESQRYSMMGQVRTPGLFDLSKPTTLLEGISRAGGLGSISSEQQSGRLADLGRSLLLRNGSVLEVDFEALVRKGDMSQNIYLKSGDFIHIGTRGVDR